MSKKLITFLLLSIFSFKTHSSLIHGHDSVIPEEFHFPKTLVASIAYEDYHLEILDLRHRDLDIMGVDLKRGNIDLLLSKEEFDHLVKDGKAITLRYEKNLLMRPDQEYKNPDEIEAFMKDMAERFPVISKLTSIGQSVEGRNIWAIKISDNPSLDEVEPAILFNSMHHAREVMTPEVSIDIIEYLLTNYEKDPKVRNWVDQNEIWVVPMLNVDGNVKVWTADRMWRKNTRNGYGVDINRNYPYKWASCNGSSGRTWSQTYRGPSAASEPETQALMGLVSMIKPVFNISYHSYSELVLYPYGCQGEKTQTHSVVAKIGYEIGDLLDYTPGTPWEILYGVDGGDVDWMYADQQVIPYVIELNSSREGFQPSYSQWRDRTVERNRPAWMHLLDRLAETGVRGLVYDESGKVTSNYVVDVIDKEGNLFQTYKGNPDGSFHIVLNQGDYSFKVKRTDSRGLKTSSLTLGNTLENIEVRFDSEEEN